MRDIDTIIIHCSYTKPSQDIGASVIRGWHVNERGWSDIGYHFVIRRDGVVEGGRDLEEVGAHAYGHNQGSIGICLVGGMSESGGPDFNFTFPQLSSLKELVAKLVGGLDIPKVIGHRDVSDKECPCFDVKEFFK